MENIALIESFSEFKDDKSIDKPTLMAILEDVLRSALKKKYGEGAIYMTESISEACKDYNLLPDFDFTIENADEYGKTLFPGNGIEFIHRNTAQTDVYFVSNQHYKAKTVEAKFRVSLT